VSAWLRAVRAVIVECPDSDAPGTTLVMCHALRSTGLDWVCQLHGENIIWRQSNTQWDVVSSTGFAGS
jgi:hypothetical protein